ncbi:hypothetical protein [Marinithermus hydrothermalis]|uniref:P pilus assembly protein, chaperone PapD n=1 Tax=Marinithermus hydrothermalis (strain DSM 14884 / JCM 11576 / T1) TaxID=869210 RepID=F2NLS6_MARHT|nr:hypothetical protein [Marinithermus hydrothermalis]AEB10906.1 hypothetical protein Marky_0143 [Marinithermus hydrothermalis DSM 14884]
MFAGLARLPRGLIGGAVLLWSWAAAQAGIGVAPPRFEFTATPGQTLPATVTVFAAESPTLRIVPSVTDWLLDPAGTLLVLPPNSHAYSAAPWIHLEASPFELTADAPRDIRFNLTVPEGARGTYWAALAFTTEPQPGVQQGVEVLIQTQILAIVYVTVAGTERPGAEIASTFVETDAAGRRYAVADVINTGNVYLRLQGRLTLKNTQGATVRTLELGERVLLRDGVVRYRVPLPEDLPEDTLLAAFEIAGVGPETLYGEVMLR